MPVFGKGLIFAARYIRNLRGGSQPILVQANDGLQYVVKFNNNLQGANLPFNEGVGSEIYRACGLACPTWKPLLVTDTFIDQTPACWMQTPEGRLRPSAGLSFASRYLGGNDTCLQEILPRTSFKRIRNGKSFWLAWLIDICAENVDNRQAIFLERGSGSLEAYFFDHGHLFGGPQGDQRRPFLASRYLDPRIYPTLTSGQLMTYQKAVLGLDADRLWRLVQTIPDSWKTESALNRFTQFLCRVSTANLVQNVVDTMVDAHLRANRFEDSVLQGMRKPPVSILHPGLQAVRFNHFAAVRSLDESVCAGRRAG